MKSTIFFKNTTPELILAFLFSASLLTDIEGPDQTARICRLIRTYLYNFDPLKPHFYIVKLGFALFFLFLLKNIDCGFSLEPPRRSGSDEDP